MLNLPIYLLGSSYYLDIRVDGSQVKRSLRTSYKREAIIRAIALLNGLRMSTPQKYGLNLASGILKADGEEDHSRLMQAIEAMRALHSGQATMQAATVTSTCTALLKRINSFKQRIEDMYKNTVLIGILFISSISYAGTSDAFSKAETCSWRGKLIGAIAYERDKGTPQKKVVDYLHKQFVKNKVKRSTINEYADAVYRLPDVSPDAFVKLGESMCLKELNE